MYTAIRGLYASHSLSNGGYGDYMTGALLAPMGGGGRFGNLFGGFGQRFGGGFGLFGGGGRRWFY
ncbi:hypothetical protein BDZ45DRAFT_747923 [Acephala macrosclerotiorum]|nr:hypothetical protein BDZ45DRAFT_747923 [Acephala macrosclerotiorum]